MARAEGDATWDAHINSSPVCQKTVDVFCPTDRVSVADIEDDTRTKSDLITNMDPMQVNKEMLSVQGVMETNMARVRKKGRASPKEEA